MHPHYKKIFALKELATATAKRKGTLTREKRRELDKITGERLKKRVPIKRKKTVRWGENVYHTIPRRK